jgi:hypothetical protein
MKIPIDISRSQLAELEEIAKTMGKSRDDVIRTALAEYQAQLLRDLKDEDSPSPEGWKEAFVALDKAEVPEDF